MSLPPERVCIKRKKDEEPVDALYIQAEHQQKKARFKDFVFRRVHDEAELETDTAPRIPQPHAANQPGREARNRVPVVRTTVRDDEATGNISENGAGLPLTAESNTAPALETAPTSSQKPGPKSISTTSHPPPHSSHPRLFQLTRPTSGSVAQGPVGGVQKRKRGEKSDVAIFIERQRELKRPRSLVNIITSSTTGAHPENRKTNIDHEAVEKEEEELRPRKRPGASAAERKWREENWTQTKPRILGNTQQSKGGKTVQSKASEWDYESTRLAEQLQDVALQEMQQYEAAQPPRSASPSMKLKPKVPALRYKDRHPEQKGEDQPPLSTMDTEHSDDEEYVYDTYLRHPDLPIGSDNFMALEKNIGFLVITEEDQPIWETYAEDEDDSDKDWNSEEEDENAENYYAADYPEEEVDSEDEFDRAAYHFRHGGSDEEEFDADSPTWSDDDEDMVRYPWKRNAWSISVRDALHDDNDSDS